MAEPDGLAPRPEDPEESPPLGEKEGKGGSLGSLRKGSKPPGGQDKLVPWVCLSQEALQVFQRVLYPQEGDGHGFLFLPSDPFIHSLIHSFDCCFL